MKSTRISIYPQLDLTSLTGSIAKHANPTARYIEWLKPRSDEDIESALEDGRAVVREQVTRRIDISTGGEAPRKHYVYRHLRYIRRYDFEKLAKRLSRGGVWSPKVPVQLDVLRPGIAFRVKNWRNA